MLDALFVQEVANFYDGFFSRLELVGEPLSDVEFDKSLVKIPHPWCHCDWTRKIMRSEKMTL
jgi:hypothetical protein